MALPNGQSDSVVKSGKEDPPSMCEGVTKIPEMIHRINLLTQLLPPMSSLAKLRSKHQASSSSIVRPDSRKRKEKHTILLENRLLVWEEEVVVEHTVEHSLVGGTPVEGNLVQGTLEEDKGPLLDTLFSFIIHNRNNHLI
ncbi:uncharacterized protein LOC133285115 [Gastrolobium bilobum]|uniref:uncharacterized protein LOC133285115 n=1 Tax=Gastrolobium bilobum TaxID=150636 RepID=UPI002AB0FCEC|nr:uncharacterized protein LOC133285115 [Gastrolobium bilobum]